MLCPAPLFYYTIDLNYSFITSCCTHGYTHIFAIKEVILDAILLSMTGYTSEACTWWSVDIGSSQCVDKVIIFNRDDGDDGYGRFSLVIKA